MRIRIHGMLDPHTHLRDLEWAHKATFTSETQAALAGGYTAVFDMPNTPPNTTTQSALHTKLEALQARACCDYGVFFGASQAHNQAEYRGLRGVCGLKIFNNATTGTLLIDSQAERLAHYQAWDNGKVIAVHAEGETVRDILEIVRQARRFTHFLHISTAEEIQYLRDAKEEGLPISIGVCPHHLYLTENDVPVLDNLARMKPELKTPRDQQALWEALQAGLIDVVESDHAPHTLAEKYDPSGRVVFGVPGLETTLPLMLLAVHEGRLKLEQIPQLLAENPRRIFGVPTQADTYTDIETESRWNIDRAKLHTACGWSPFEGMTVFGKVERVVIRGQVAYDGEQVCVGAGFGRNLFA